MDELKELWANKHEPQGRIDITVFFGNIFMLLSHAFLTIMYIIIGNIFMIAYGVLTMPLYIYYIKHCYKNIDKYMGIAFLEIWVQMICGILSFGWTPCYQNWCFAMIVAYFLPAFNKDNKFQRQRPIYYALLIIATYFFLATFFPLVDLRITTELDIYMNSILFISNNTITFIAIILFAVFYTRSNDRRERKLSRKADYDELTNIYNRHALNELGNMLINNAKENKKAYSVAILDIDHFKKINDKYGHTSGDLVLKRVANIMKIYSDKGIICGRWGGEEFIMIAPHTMRYATFTKILEDMRKRIGEAMFNIENNEKINITISIGASKLRKYKDLETAVSVADVNLYEAKETGRNKLVK